MQRNVTAEQAIAASTMPDELTQMIQRAQGHIVGRR
jgi:hypothetical protein